MRAILRSLIKFSALLQICFVQVSCTGPSSSSLLTDNISTVNANAINKTPNSSDISLSVDMDTWNIPSGGDQVEISGNCFISTYSFNRIDGYVVLNGGNQTQIPLQPILGNSQNMCNQGRYDILINKASLSSSNTALRLILSAWSTDGQLVSNDSNAVRQITIRSY